MRTPVAAVLILLRAFKFPGDGLVSTAISMAGAGCDTNTSQWRSRMKIYGAIAVPVAAIILAAPAGAIPTNGSLLVPGDIAPGNYWATPTDYSLGGYVEVCADYACQIGEGLIENYTINGRTMIPIPDRATMVKVDHVLLTAAA